MRKYLLFFFFLGAIISNSIGQDIQIFNSENVLIPNNSVIQVYGNPTDDQIKTVLWLKNTSLENISLSVSKEVITASDANKNSFYWDSYIEQNESPAYSLFLGPNQISKDFQALYSPNSNKGISQVKYTFFDINHPQISSTVIVEFITDNSFNSFEPETNFSLSDVYPNPAESMAYLDYAMEGRILEAKIIIRTLLGSIVSEANLEGAYGKASINVSDLIDGIYFYSLVIDSEIKLTKKLIVKH